MRFFRLISTSGLALAVFLMTACRALDLPSFDPAPLLGKNWYGLYVQGEKVGCAEMTISGGRLGDTPTVVFEVQQTGRWMEKGEQVESRSEERYTYAATGRQELLEAHSLRSSGAESVERTGTRGKDGFVIRTLQGKEVSERETVPLPRETLSDCVCGEILALTGARVGTKRRVPSFDMDEGAEMDDEYEVVGFEEGFSDGIKVKIVVVRDTEGKTGEARTFRMSPEGMVLEQELAGAAQVRLEPEALAKDLHYSADLYTKGLLHTETRLGDPERVRALTLRIRGSDPALKLPSDGRQTVRMEADGALLLILRTDMFREELQAATAQDCKNALRSTSEYPCTNPEIQALAEKAVGDASDLEKKVWRLVVFVDDYVEHEHCTTSVSALDVLRNRKGDCSEHTMLFVALCRAVGAPAREVDGLMYGGDYFGAFGGHAWAEVALDGRWVSVDPTLGEFPVDATHIKLDEAGRSENSVRMLTGTMKVEVVSVETSK